MRFSEPVSLWSLADFLARFLFIALLSHQTTLTFAGFGFSRFVFAAAGFVKILLHSRNWTSRPTTEARVFTRFPRKKELKQTDCVNVKTKTKRPGKFSKQKENDNGDRRIWNNMLFQSSKSNLTKHKSHAVELVCADLCNPMHAGLEWIALSLEIQF